MGWVICSFCHVGVLFSWESVGKLQCLKNPNVFWDWRGMPLPRFLMGKHLMKDLRIRFPKVPSSFRQMFSHQKPGKRHTAPVPEDVWIFQTL
jgi:hypothetical protein